jgi:hypothetical protein
MTAEQEAYEALSYYTLEHRDPAFIHQHIVDTFTAQNANEQTKPIAVTFALVGLYLHVEHQFSGKQVQRAHMQLAKQGGPWPRFDLPSDRGSIHAVDVIAAPPGAERDRAIDAWCAAVWNVFRGNQATVGELLKQRGII